MQTFLDTLITHLQKSGTKAYQDLVIVLPSQRAGVFLRNKLRSYHMGQTLMLPQIISIEDFIEQLSGIVPMENTEVMMLFYEAYLLVHPEEEKKDFSSFLSWGQTLLQDFNEIDRYLVDQDRFFKYLYYINDQKHWFLQENKTHLIEDYIQFWERLQSYYTALTAKMNEQQKGYQGHQYRMAAQNVDAYAEVTRHKYLFAGFNALNNAEQYIIKSFLQQQKGEVFWDADEYFLNDYDHDASLFLKRFKKDWKAPNGFEYSVHQSFQESKNITITGIPKNIGQVKYIGQILEKMPAEELTKTALVLADETLLLPMLNSLPKNVANVNITMGLSLSQIPLTVFVNQLMSLKETHKGHGFYCQEVLAILHNFYTKTLIGDEVAEQLHQLIIKNNWVYVEMQTLLKHAETKTHKNLKLLFGQWESNKQTLQDLERLLNILLDYFTEKEDHLQITYIQKTQEVVELLVIVVSAYTYISELKVLRQLLNEKIAAESIDFRGEPLQGLQIMGVLESRCLDFENVIIASVNEGILPSGKKSSSFIPFDLKIDTNLPTYKEKDAIYAYHFYRLLQRCSQAHLIYNTQVDEMNSGEKSRFIQQLELEPHPNHTITSAIASAATGANYTPITEIQKNIDVIEKLKKLAAYGFSPSALGSYLRNPLAFYEQYILGVRDAEEVEEEVAANTLGTVIHNVLENFYKPFEGKILVIQDIKTMLKNTPKAIEKEFQTAYSSAQIISGLNYITVQAAIEYVVKFLKTELSQLEAGNEIHVVAIESNLKVTIPTKKLDFPVVIKGKVDRVDRLNGQLRIVDYKTGFVNPSHLKIKNWESLVEDDKHSKALQILMYAYMYCQQKNINTPVQGGIISFKKLNDGFLPFGVHTTGRNYDLEITSDIFDEFLIQLETLITEICDINLPFIQKDEPTRFS